MDNEFDRSPVAPGLQPVHRNDEHQHRKLDPAEKLILANWFTSGEYQVFLKLAEGEIEKAETEHFQKWKEPLVFERTGIFAVAMRAFFERLQKETKHQYDEFAGELAFMRQQEADEKISAEDLARRNAEQ